MPLIYCNAFAVTFISINAYATPYYNPETRKYQNASLY